MNSDLIELFLSTHPGLFEWYFKQLKFKNNFIPRFPSFSWNSWHFEKNQKIQTFNDNIRTIFILNVTKIRWTSSRCHRSRKRTRQTIRPLSSQQRSQSYCQRLGKVNPWKSIISSQRSCQRNHLSRRNRSGRYSLRCRRRQNNSNSNQPFWKSRHSHQ